VDEFDPFAPLTTGFAPAKAAPPERAKARRRQGGATVAAAPARHAARPEPAPAAQAEGQERYVQAGQYLTLPDTPDGAVLANRGNGADPTLPQALTATPALASKPPGYRLSVKEMAPDERPRERLKLRGPQSLSDGDLLAILLNTGIVGETVTDVAQRVLAEHGGLRGLMQMDVAELARVRGLGDAKAVRLKAALELGRRLAALVPEARPQVTAPDDVANLLAIEMAALPQEQLRAVLLDTKHRVLSIRTVYQGTVNQAQVRVAEVFRDAIRQNAVALVAVHNHPSGDPTPSSADAALTAELHRAGELLGIELLDHLVIGQGRWVSLRRLGLGFPTA
jgi:DNA repair protein RadC